MTRSCLPNLAEMGTTLGRHSPMGMLDEVVLGPPVTRPQKSFAAVPIGDIIYALASPEVFGLLVIDRGWSLDRYQKWLAETLVAQLLA